MLDKKIEKKNKIDKNKKEEKLNLEELRKELEQCFKEKDEYLAGWQRARADFLNYRKEETERIGEILKYANLDLILKILPILDNFDLAARQNFPSENLSGQEKKIIDGFFQIKIQILDFLKNQGIEEIKTIGEKFDPSFHEVIEEVSVENLAEAEVKNKESGIIVEEIQKCYTLHGRVVRPARVKVVK